MLCKRSDCLPELQLQEKHLSHSQNLPVTDITKCSYPAAARSAYGSVKTH